MKLTKFYVEPADENNYDIMSVCAFRIKGSYKPAELYYNGLNTLVDMLPAYLPNFYLRVYIDASIVEEKHKIEEMNKEIREHWKPLIDKMKKLKHVQLVQYEVPDFLEDDQLYHEGLFGTFMRFLPLFDEKNKGVVFVTDIDIKLKFLESAKKLYLKFMDSKSQVHSKTYPCYYTYDRFYLNEKLLSPDEKLDTWVRFMGGAVISKIKFPKYLLEDFLSCAKKHCDTVSRFLDNQGPYIEEDKQKFAMLGKTSFIYGLDEYFLNIILLKYIEKNKIQFSYTMFISEGVDSVFYNLYLRQNKYKNIDTKTINFFKDIMGKYYKNHLSFYQNYEFFDAVIYKLKNQKKNIFNYFYGNIIRIFKNLIENGGYEQYGLRKEELECITKIGKPQITFFEMYSYETDPRYK